MGNMKKIRKLGKSMKIETLFCFLNFLLGGMGRIPRVVSTYGYNFLTYFLFYFVRRFLVLKRYHNFFFRFKSFFIVMFA